MIEAMRLSLFAGMCLCVLSGACASDEARGHELYLQHGCAVCHGTDARGHGPSAGRLATPPRDLTNMRQYRQGASSEDIAASIRAGSGRNNAMPAFSDLTPDEARQIGAWLVSIQRSPVEQ